MNEALLQEILNKLNLLETQLESVNTRVGNVHQEVNKLQDNWKAYTMDDVVSRLKYLGVTLHSIEGALDDIAQD
ncbi:hypothetical protein [Cesiribacter sp. SM1]|uniref:hypothetical protein n=1 Tax=Cesiribacter sp. SM1 TaxID=2861196 RepID=UPI001CD3CAF8|nr:hypothetical protein [Cesiribacter sp. SM1]